GGGGATVTALTPRAVKNILPTSIDYDVEPYQTEYKTIQNKLGFNKVEVSHGNCPYYFIGVVDADMRTTNIALTHKCLAFNSGVAITTIFFCISI
ncbi:unnamed protein product, partial [Brassica oleracea var. botrytis]